jgi:hypothetical protein
MRRPLKGLRGGLRDSIQAGGRRRGAEGGTTTTAPGPAPPSILRDKRSVPIGTPQRHPGGPVAIALTVRERRTAPPTHQTAIHPRRTRATDTNDSQHTGSSGDRGLKAAPTTRTTPHCTSTHQRCVHVALRRHNGADEQIQRTLHLPGADMRQEPHSDQHDGGGRNGNKRRHAILDGREPGEGEASRANTEIRHVVAMRTGREQDPNATTRLTTPDRNGLRQRARRTAHDTSRRDDQGASSSHCGNGTGINQHRDATTGKHESDSQWA